MSSDSVGIENALVDLLQKEEEGENPNEFNDKEMASKCSRNESKSANTNNTQANGGTDDNGEKNKTHYGIQDMSLFFDQNIESMRASRRFREKWELDSAKELLDEEGYQKYKEKLDYDVKNIPPAPKKYDDEETQRRFEEVWSLWQHAAVAPKRFSQLDEKRKKQIIQKFRSEPRRKATPEEIRKQEECLKVLRAQIRGNRGNP